MSGDLDSWAVERAAGARRALRRAVDASGSEHFRPQFGQRVRPLRGAVLASPRRALWDPEPDYFHCWARDGAIAMRLAPRLAREGAGAGEADFWRGAFADWLRFQLAVTDPDAPAPEGNPLRATTRPDAVRFLRPDGELRALRGAARLAEPRWSPDGAPDAERWGRPQHDGPALRAAVCLDALDRPGFDGPALRAMLARDLAFLERVAGEPCIGPWEDEPARLDAFTLIVQHDALDRAARRAWTEGDPARARALDAAAERALGAVAPARDARGVWRGSAEPGAPLDAAAALAMLWAGRRSGPFALDGADAEATFAALEAMSGALYPINRGAEAPAIGRFEADDFFGGNPWLPTTLAFAERCYRLAADHGAGAEAVARGDAFLGWARRVSPEGDALPEQVDRETGAPAGCRDLAWSAAAFLSALAERDRARAGASRRSQPRTGRRAATGP